MKQRVLTAIAIVAVVIPVFIFSNTVEYPIVLSLLSLIAEFEMLRALGRHQDFPVAIPAYLIAPAFPVIGYLWLEVWSRSAVDFLALLAAILFAYLLYLFALAVLRRGKTTFADLAETFVTAFYIIVSFTSLALVRYLENGVFYFGIPYIAAWVCDVFALFTGKFFGKHKLSPEISPKKTIEGAIGGTLFGTAALLVYGLILQLAVGARPLYGRLLLYGLLLTVAGQIGDLIASLIKREHAIKDYGKILPGHGGILDRFDSVIATSGVLAVLCIVFPPFAV